MVYDEADRYTLAYLICLYGSFTFDSCTWRYSNDSWTNSTPSSGANPPGFLPSSLVWDAPDQSVLLFGGIPYAHPGNWTNLWSYKAGVWTNLTTSVPAGLSKKFFDGAVYDSSDGYVVLLFRASSFNDTTHLLSWFTSTWTYQSGVWTNITDNLTVARALPILSTGANDPTDSGVVFFGGSNSTGTTNRTWLFTHGQWEPVSSPTAPSPRYEFSMTFDSFDGYVLLVGGLARECSGNCRALGDEWTFAHDKWTNISNVVRGDLPTESDGVMTSDLADGYVLEGFGWGGVNATGYSSDFQTGLYSYLNGTWTFSGPPAASSPFWGEPWLFAVVGGVVVVAAAVIVLLVRRRRPPTGPETEPRN